MTGVGGDLAATRFDRLIAFGDSLTDDGHGFDRYTNGPVWVDYLAAGLAIPTVDNRAWGGAMTGYGNARALDWSGLGWQVDQFAPTPDLATTLFTVWIGTNDIYDGDADVAVSVGNVKHALDGLAAKGARHLMVVSLPDITLAPAYRAGTQHAADTGRVRKLVEEFNRALGVALTGSDDGFAARHPEVELYRVDAHALFDRIARDGTFQNTTEPWLGTHQCPEPDGHMWWDEWHPMTEVHRRVATEAAAALGRLRTLPPVRITDSIEHPPSPAWRGSAGR